MKLLKEISYRYLTAALVLFIISLPLLYLGLQRVITETVDEELIHQKEWVLQKLKSIAPEQIQDLNPNISIGKTNTTEKERIYSENLYVAADKEMVPHRVLNTSAAIHGTNYHISIKKSLVETDDVIASIMMLLALFLGIILFSLFYVNKALSKKIWKPFNQMLEALKNFRVDAEEEMQLPAANISEFKELQQSILKLAGTNTQLFKAQKTFTENAAHELQTPIAIILAHIDLLLQQPELNADQANHIENISMAANKMKRLNKALLLLSKIENKTYVERSNMNINEVAQQYIKTREDIVSNKGLILDLQWEASFIAKMNKDLAEILISNLIENAFRHTNNNGHVFIEAHQDSFIIANSANGDSLQSGKLFQRFQKQSNHPNSLGLGLEIARQICNISDMQLQYEFKNNTHSFTINKK